MSAQQTTIYTIGHSTHSIQDFIDLLKAYGIERLIDIRTIPRSRHNPQFEQTAMEQSLPAAGIGYIYMKDLGGLRPKTKDTINMGWHNASFRNYADYMQTHEFEMAIDHLIKIAEKNTVAIMCAEAVPWRCHRSLVGDALTARGITVRDIMNEKTAPLHKLTAFAVVEGTKVTYPDDEKKR